MDDNYGKPKRFWEEHTWVEYESNGQLYGPIPRTDEQFKTFFERCAVMIEARGKSITQ